MKRFLVAMGVSFIVLLCAYVAFVIFITLKNSALDKESKAYVDKVIPRILSDMRKETLLEYLLEEPDTQNETENIELMFRLWSQLGHLKQYHGSKGKAQMRWSWGNGISTEAKYTAEADFDKGPATVDLELEKVDGKWKIHFISIASKAYRMPDEMQEGR